MIFDENKHTTQIKYPNKTDFKIYYVYKQGRCLASGDIVAIGDFIEWSSHTAAEYPHMIIDQVKAKGYLIETHLDEDAYENHRLQFGIDKAEKHKKYLDDLYTKEYSLSISREIFYICYEESWQRNHSGGYPEVENCLADIVVFAERIAAAKE